MILLLLLTLLTPAQPEYSGAISAYAEAPSVATLEYNAALLPPDLSNYFGAVAVNNCDAIGAEALLEYDGKYYLMIVADCAGGADGGAQWMNDYNVCCELFFGAAQKLPDAIGQQGRIIIGCNWADACVWPVPVLK